jgi:hypothetical protein
VTFVPGFLVIFVADVSQRRERGELEQCHCATFLPFPRNAPDRRRFMPEEKKRCAVPVDPGRLAFIVAR